MKNKTSIKKAIENTWPTKFAHTLTLDNCFRTVLIGLIDINGMTKTNKAQQAVDALRVIQNTVQVQADLLMCLKEVVNDIPRINKKEFYRQAIAKAEGK